jgi:hypothetical protein
VQEDGSESVLLLWADGYKKFEKMLNGRGIVLGTAGNGDGWVELQIEVVALLVKLLVDVLELVNMLVTGYIIAHVPESCIRCPQDV